MGAVVNPFWLLLTLATFAGFYFLVKKHEALRENSLQLGYRKAFFENELGILNGKANQYFDGAAFAQATHPYTDDLDVFGAFSLFSMLNRAATYLGINYLKSAFLKESKNTIYETQEAAKEIENKSTWHEGFLGTLFPLIHSDKSKTQAVYEFKFDDKIKYEGFIKRYAMLIPFIWIAVIAAGYFLGWTWTGGLGFLILIFNFRIVGINRELSDAYFQKIEGVYQTLEPIQEAIELIQKEKWSSALAANLQDQIPSYDHAKNPIRAFGFLIKKLESRKNQFASFFLYLYSPFDVIQLIKLKKWNAENPSFFKNILTVIGEFELLASYAMCAVNHKDWSYPEVKTEVSFSLKALKLGHPLLGNENVRNDFDLNKNNRLSIITGSNMSGKSTFLRAVGTNVLLAYMGAPVCATKMSLSQGINMITYMRIKDDLSLNVSTFKAEIIRVKMIVEAIDSKENYLFLIDEMLRGTNSEDKLKGAIALLRKIANSKTFGLVATHDLRATEVSSEFPDVIKNFFFEFKNVNDDLEFDYKLKAGVCQSFNASQLLRRAGLDV